jgi:hypothetical protein
MPCFFITFTIYKPYLLMYDIRQALQICIHTSQLCLEKDVHALHKKYLDMLEAYIIEHVVK